MAAAGRNRRRPADPIDQTEGPTTMLLHDAINALQLAIRNTIRDVKAAAKAPRVILAILVAETTLATRRK